VRAPTTSLALVCVFAGCSTGPRHVSPSKFQRSFIKSQTVMLENFFYAGETNGCIYISHMHLPRTDFSQMHYEFLFTETNGLSPDFLQTLGVLTIPL
jgi:hypothetical protein